MFFLTEFENLLRQCKEIGLWLRDGHTVVKTGVRECWSVWVRGMWFPLTPYSITPMRRSPR
jgi:hypothetical protein